MTPVGCLCGDQAALLAEPKANRSEALVCTEKYRAQATQSSVCHIVAVSIDSFPSMLCTRKSSDGAAARAVHEPAHKHLPCLLQTPWHLAAGAYNLSQRAEFNSDHNKLHTSSTTHQELLVSGMRNLTCHCGGALAVC